MLSGELPFYECPTCEEEAVLNLSSKHWSQVSDSTKQTITKMLAFNPQSRLLMDELNI